MEDDLTPEELAAIQDKVADVIIDHVLATSEGHPTCKPLSEGRRAALALLMADTRYGVYLTAVHDVACCIETQRKYRLMDNGTYEDIGPW